MTLRWMTITIKCHKHQQRMPEWYSIRKQVATLVKISKNPENGFMVKETPFWKVPCLFGHCLKSFWTKPGKRLLPTVGRERERDELCKYLIHGIWAQNLKDNICEDRLRHKWGLSQSSNCKFFFLQSLSNLTTHKISFYWGPIFSFHNAWCYICKFYILDICCKYFVKKTES